MNRLENFMFRAGKRTAKTLPGRAKDLAVERERLAAILKSAEFAESRIIRVHCRQKRGDSYIRLGPGDQAITYPLSYKQARKCVDAIQASCKNDTHAQDIGRISKYVHSLDVNLVDIPESWSGCAVQIVRMPVNEAWVLLFPQFKTDSGVDSNALDGVDDDKIVRFPIERRSLRKIGVAS